VRAPAIHVLVIEDNPTDMLLLREALQGEGFVVTGVERLAEGLKRRAEGSFDVVLVDLGLPDSQGIGSFTAVHDAAPGVAILVLTILDDEEVALCAVREGAQDYLIKGEVDSRRIRRPIRYAIERKRLQDELARLLEREQQARREAEEANRSKDRFLMMVSHELRTPLTAITGWVNMLRQHELDAASHDRGLDVIARNTELLQRIVEDLLDFARIASGKVRIEARPVELSTVVDAALDTVQLAALAKGLRLSSSLDPAGARVMGDPDRLQQVVWNLLANAIKFTPAGGEVDVRLEREGADAKIRVRDTGKGLLEEDMEHIFQAFHQTETPSGRTGGLGLGLAIVRHLVEMHGGTIRAMSGGQGQGATFEVTLPLAA